MPLHAVTVTGVYPPQVITVWDSKTAADNLAAHLSALPFGEFVKVREVDSFFPAGYTEANKAWRDATNAYLRGDHINTSGDKE